MRNHWVSTLRRSITTEPFQKSVFRFYKATRLEKAFGEAAHEKRHPRLAVPSCHVEATYNAKHPND